VAVAVGILLQQEVLVDQGVVKGKDQELTELVTEEKVTTVEYTYLRAFVLVAVAEPVK
jgi:hypothetical protein